MFAWSSLFLGSFFLALATGSVTWGLAVLFLLAAAAFFSTDITDAINRLAEAVISFKH